MSRKGIAIDDCSMESSYAVLKKKTFYNITNLEEYINIVKDWLLFYFYSSKLGHFKIYVSMHEFFAKKINVK